MNQEMWKEKLGEPALKIAGFQLWIHGWEFPEGDNYADGWLRITAHCGDSGADVWVQTSILINNLWIFGKQCKEMMQGDATFAEIAPFEPELYVRLEFVDRNSQLHATVKITPNHLTQSHMFKFEIDQSCLPVIIESCSNILAE